MCVCVDQHHHSHIAVFFFAGFDESVPLSHASLSVQSLIHPIPSDGPVSITVTTPFPFACIMIGPSLN